MDKVVTRRKKLAIIDGKSVFYRAFMALPDLSTKDGTSTGGVFGFANIALEVIRTLKPDYVAVAWDKPKTNIRKRLELYPEYKAGRSPAPPGFHEQVIVLHELLQAFGWPLYELDDYEADDIMGTLGVQAAKRDIDAMLVTSDLDMLQLIDPHIHVYAIKKGFSHIELYSPKSFEAKYHLRAEQFLDFKALIGDNSDNIPGVPHIGPVAATKLLQGFKTLDGIYENIELISGKTKEYLIAGKDLAYLSKKLCAIWTDAPIKLNLDEVDGSKVQPEKVLHMLQKLEFRSLARQLPEVMQVAINNHVAQSDTQSHTQVGRNAIVDTVEKLARLDFSKADTLVVHSRSAGKHGKDPQLLIISPNPQTTYTLDLTKLSKKSLSPHSSLLTPPQVPLIGYDVKSTLKILLELGLPDLPPVGHDVLIGAFLLNSLRREQTLTELAQADLDYEGSSLEDLSPEELTQRAPEIIGVIRALYERQNKTTAHDSRLKALSSDIEWPIIPVLARMEHVGIQLDCEYLSKFSEQINDTISDLEQQIYGHADQEFNIGSPAQLADILFIKLNLSKDGIKRGKTGYSTAASELDKLRGVHPIIDLITQYREVVKLKNTYVDTLPKMVDEHSRLHTTFNLTIAQTGRLSSTDPNLQNIPVRTELGKHIRTAFVAGPGNVLIGADYSQFELRLAAYLSSDEALIKQFNNDVDVHTMTAAEVYGREPEDVTKNMRRVAKVVNFGVMYGLSPHGLVAATGMTYQQAKAFIEKYFEVRPKLLAYIESLKEKARKDGYVETLFGRRRPTPDVHSTNFVVREAAIRQAVNMPIQGTEADLMKMAMISVQQKLDESSGIGRQSLGQRQATSDRRLVTNIPRILLQIHDSILVECPQPDAEQTAKLLKDTMEQAYKLSVKLTVDTSIGKNWGEL